MREFPATTHGLTHTSAHLLFCEAVIYFSGCCCCFCFLLQLITISAKIDEEDQSNNAHIPQYDDKVQFVVLQLIISRVTTAAAAVSERTDGQIIVHLRCRPSCRVGVY